MLNCEVRAIEAEHIPGLGVAKSCTGAFISSCRCCGWEQKALNKKDQKWTGTRSETCFQSVSMYEHKATDNSSGKSVSMYEHKATDNSVASYLLLVVLQQLVLVVLVLELLLELLPPQLQFL